MRDNARPPATLRALPRQPRFSSARPASPASAASPQPPLPPPPSLPCLVPTLCLLLNLPTSGPPLTPATPTWQPADGCMRCSRWLCGIFGGARRLRHGERHQQRGHRGRRAGGLGEESQVGRRRSAGRRVRWGPAFGPQLARRIHRRAARVAPPGPHHVDHASDAGTRPRTRARPPPSPPRPPRPLHPLHRPLLPVFVSLIGRRLARGRRPLAQRAHRRCSSSSSSSSSNSSSSISRCSRSK